MIIILPSNCTRIVAGHAEARPPRHRPEQAPVPFIHHLHGNHAPAQSELDRLTRAQFHRAPQVQIAPVGRPRVREQEFPILEANCGVPRADGAVIQDHVALRTTTEEKRARSVQAVRLEQGAETQLKTRVEEALGHFVFGGHKKGDVGRLKGGFEQFHRPAVLELEIAPERGLADAASRVDATEEADLVVSLGRVPLAKAINVDVASVPLALTGGYHGIGGRVLLVEAHVAGGNVVAEGGRALDGHLVGGVVVRIF